MKIICISDTHNKPMMHPVPDGDILIHAGDATIQGTVEEINEFADWFLALPHKHKVFVAGNHDWLYERKPKLANALVQSLCDEWIEIEGLKIYGSPWQPEFHNWAFNLPRGETLARKWRLIPEDTDILVTHTPPMNFLDLNPRGSSVGCRDLFDAVMRIKPRLHVFGHLHGCGGKKIKVDNTIYVNAAICDEAYQAVRKPVVVEL